MNILYLCDEYPPGRHGGIGTVVQCLAREMVLQGHNVVVAGFYDWGYGGEDNYDDKGVKVFRFKRGLDSKVFSNPDSLTTRVIYRIFKAIGVFQNDIYKSLKKYQLFLEKLIAEFKIDIVEMPDYNDYMRFCNSIVSFPKLSVPTIVKLHGSMTYYGREANREVPVHIRKMEHDLLCQADKVVSVSNYTANKTSTYLDYKRVIDVLYNGVDVHIKPDKVMKIHDRVIFTGTLVEKKGIYQLVKAWNIVNAQMPEAELIVLGKGPIEKISKLLNLKALKRVQFKGHVSREVLLEYVASSQIAVLPSYAETFGLAAIEAMVCGTAVIYTNRTVGGEIVDDTINGLLVDPDNVEDIASKIVYLLQNAEICDQLALRGNEKSIKKFNIEVIAKQHEELYNNVVNNVRIDNK
ncbi:MAG: glycosyltransferase family 4 protein [Bacteroidota bacterium]